MQSNIPPHLFSLKPNDFNNLSHYKIYKRLMRSIKDKKIVATKLTQNYFVAIMHENYYLHYYIIGLDKSTGKYFVNKVMRDDIVIINGDKDVFNVLGYDYDCDLENIGEIIVDGRYRVQGDLIINVRSEDDYIRRLTNEIESHFNSILDNIIMSRLLNIIVSEMNLNVTRFMNEIEIHLDDRILQKYTKYQIHEALINKLFELIKEYSELLFSDIVLFLSNGESEITDLNVSKTYYEIIIENNYMRIVLYVHTEEKFWIEIRLSTRFNFENIVNDIIKSLQFSRFESTFGRHRIIFENSIPNRLQIKLKLNLREIDDIIVNINTNNAILARDKIIFMHSEHGTKEIVLNDIKTISIDNVRNDLERAMNSYNIISLINQQQNS